MHEKIITSLFNDSAQATAAVRRLESAGISTDHIATFGAGADRRWDASQGSPASRTSVPSAGSATSVAPSGTSSSNAASTGASEDSESTHVGMWLESVGVPHHDADAYEEGVRRGGALVVVSCVDEKVDTVIDIVDQEGVVDLEERRTAWASEGWTGRKSESGDATIPIAQEELHVGKRDTAGRVRIHKHVEARPASETVELRDEHVSVDRRPVDRVATAAERDSLFKDETVEMTERHEKPVISKEAHVREEVVVHKDVDRHEETVRDTTRRTEIDVEDDRRDAGSRTGRR